MASRFTGGYDERTERHRRAFYETRSEKDRRRYAAGEAEKLGHGGHKSIMNLLGCSKMTLTRGRAELDRLAEEGDPAECRQRRKGGGRKPKIAEDPQGEGEVGQPIGKGQDEGDGQGQAGSEAGAHIREVEVSLDELAEMLGEELELPKQAGPRAIFEFDDTLARGCRRRRRHFNECRRHRGGLAMARFQPFLQRPAVSAANRNPASAQRPCG